VRLQFIEPGKPIHNAFIESFNSRLREECLNEHVFASLDAHERRAHWRSRGPQRHELGVTKLRNRSRGPLPGRAVVAGGGRRRHHLCRLG
jgi:integrase-like protein